MGRRNNVSKLKGYFITGFFCLALGCAVTFAICKRANTVANSKLSNDLAASQATSSRITSENSQLRELNSRLTETVGRLETSLRQSDSTIASLKSRIATDNQRYNESIGTIKSAPGEAAKERGNAESGIDSVIEGLSSIAKLIEALP